MKMTTFNKLLSCLLCFVLIAAMALFTTSCSDNSEISEDQTMKEAEGENEEIHYFTFIVKNADGEETSFDIETAETVVGDALIERGLIEGEEGEFGLYVKTVNGITADYETDGTYWAFYINGEYAATGVDQTEITDGATYMFAVEG